MPRGLILLFICPVPIILTIELPFMSHMLKGTLKKTIIAWYGTMRLEMSPASQVFGNKVHGLTLLWVFGFDVRFTDDPPTRPQQQCDMRQQSPGLIPVTVPGGDGPPTTSRHLLSNVNH